MNNANPAPVGNQRPVVPQGYTISAIATDLKIPRQILVLPNGDLLVAEGKGGSAPRLTPKDFIAGYFKSKGTSSVKGGRSEEHTSELQSLMRISYAVFCLKKKKKH